MVALQVVLPQCSSSDPGFILCSGYCLCEVPASPVSSHPPNNMPAGELATVNHLVWIWVRMWLFIVGCVMYSHLPPIVSRKRSRSMGKPDQNSVVTDKSDLFRMLFSLDYQNWIPSHVCASVVSFYDINTVYSIKSMAMTFSHWQLHMSLTGLAGASIWWNMSRISRKNT